MLSYFFCHASVQSQTAVMAKSQVWEFSNSWDDPSQNWELKYQRFIYQFGMAKENKQCSTIKSCITSSFANPDYYLKNPKDLRISADCADLPYVLRAYFAWMNGLPFSFVSGVYYANPKLDAGRDIRYTPRGNKVSARYTVRPGVDRFNDVHLKLVNSVSSAVYRVHGKADFPANANGVLDTNSKLFTDFYSPAITRETIVPGTTVYDPAGHLLVVYRVSDDGIIYMIDAHPGNSPLTTDVYGQKFVRSNPRHGAGFKNWRPIAWDQSQSKVIAASNDLIEGYSSEQFYGNHPEQTIDDQSWQKGVFLHNGVQYFHNTQDNNYYQYVRKVLAKGDLSFDPIKEISFRLDSLCDDLKFRKEAVDSAIMVGINKAAHPLRLPENIYGTSGEWEDYSTPSRDARFKTAVRELTETAILFIKKFNEGDTSIHYTGSDLKQDLWSIFYRKAQDPSTACQIQYKNSVQQMVTVTLADLIENRLFNMSFDPYHCIELRWGATGNELSTCPDDANKKLWYQNERFLRNSPDRTYDAKMNYTATELPNSGLGLRETPVYKFSQILW